MRFHLYLFLRNSITVLTEIYYFPLSFSPVKVFFKCRTVNIANYNENILLIKNNAIFITYIHYNNMFLVIEYNFVYSIN